MLNLVLKGISPDVNLGTRLDYQPIKGSFTDWKIIKGATNDLFLPANIQRMVRGGTANKAGSPNSMKYSADVLTHAHLVRACSCVCVYVCVCVSLHM